MIKKVSVSSISGFHLSLKWKTILVCVILLAIPSMLIGYLGHRTAKQELDESGRINLRDNVQMTLQLIDAYQGMVKNGTIKLEDAQEQVRLRAIGPKKEDGKSRSMVRAIGETGYIFAMDAKGIDVMHPTREGQNVWDSKDSSGRLYVQDIIRNGTLEGGYSYYENPVPGSNKIAMKVTYSQLDPHWGWVVAAGSYLSDFNKGSDSLKQTMLMVTLGFIAVGALIAVLFAGHIASPIRAITKQAEQMASGDLAMEDIRVGNRDEVGRLTYHFNHLKDQLKQMIGRVTDSTAQVAATGEQLTAGSEETSRATEHITIAIQEVANGSQQQSDILTEINGLVSLVSERIQYIAEGADKASVSSEEARTAAAAGNVVLADTLEHMKRIEEKLQGIENAVRSLHQKSEDIGSIIALISGISVQTHILALNAGIEASRAGEQGKGFAVVAAEVKKLADQTRAATEQVSGLMEQVQLEINHAAIASQEESEAVAAGIRLASQAETSFHTILLTVEGAAARCSEMLEASGDAAIRMNGLVAAVEQIAAISSQTAGQSQGVAAAAEEQNASMEEVAAAAHELSRMADELQQAVSIFRVTGA